jgi:uncharacterized Ntn-hydrolase superfamily protein
VLRQGTYSIVARDPLTGELGVAVQSHWFSVGPVVPWVRPGVGAVATQSITERAYGPRALDRLHAGEKPAPALAELLAADPQAAYRQVAVIGAGGPPAVHTGDGCVAYAGHVTGEHFSAQANMMASATVWPAMAAAFEATGGPLAWRLMAALSAAEAQGGDVRGRQSAALVVAPSHGEPWRRVVELRVEDHDEPLAELDRLLTLHDAYTLANAGDELVSEGRHDEAGERYEAALALAPDSHELLFWAGLAAAQAGDLNLGLRRVQEAIVLQPSWGELLGRLPPELAPAAAAVQAARQSGAQGPP